MLNEIVDLRHLSWAKVRQSSGTAGSFLKSYSFSNGKKVYYKLSFFDDVNHIFGYESINEIIAERILEELNIEHLEYELIHAIVCIDGTDYETFLCSSLDFKSKNETKITLENFYDVNKSKNEKKMDFFKRYNFEEYIYNMILIDFLINNRDRHGANIEVLHNSRTNEYRLAPLFDHGLSFLSPKYLDEDIKEFDAKKVYRANSYIGTSDLTKNLDLIPIEKIPVLNLDYDYIFKDLYEYINNDYLDKAKEMLKERVDYIESIRNKK
ncbi:MAG: hypothetical protein J5936_05205 [Acholeplasmatales bacterium]|nr:hypothetical protein [Acholeplasmatales bacterium]